jgi:NADP-dependent 3-hydroxy acid dehydrogenase YdfG
MLGRDRGRLDAAAKSVPAAIALPCDVGNDDLMAEAIDQIRDQLGGAPDVLVNNAGRFHLAAIEKESADDFLKTLDVNLVGAFRLVNSFLPQMRQRGSGHIITIGSIADHSTFPENAAYAASKFGVRALHGVLREETRGSGIRATLISPGPVDTPLWDSIDPDNRPGFTPRSKMLSAAAVADAVVWAATRRAEANVDELRLSRS